MITGGWKIRALGILAAGVLLMGNAPPTRVEVSVRADPPGPNGIVWSQTFRFIPPGNGRNNNGKIHITAPGEAEIIFDLDDRSGLQLRFRPEASDAIWIAPGQCPTEPGDGGGEFELGEPRQMRLTILDRHTTQDEYHYMLRFDSRAGLLTYDPIIKN
jgi:hypothetical protein